MLSEDVSVSVLSEYVSVSVLSEEVSVSEDVTVSEAVWLVYEVDRDALPHETRPSMSTDAAVPQTAAFGLAESACLGHTLRHWKQSMHSPEMTASASEIWIPMLQFLSQAPQSEQGLSLLRMLKRRSLETREKIAPKGQR